MSEYLIESAVNYPANQLTQIGRYVHMSKKYYSDIAEYYIGLAFSFPKFDSAKIEASYELWETARMILEALPLNDWCKVQELIKRKRGAGSYIRNRPEDYRLMDSVYKAFAQRAGLI